MFTEHNSLSLPDALPICQGSCVSGGPPSERRAPPWPDASGECGRLPHAGEVAADPGHGLVPMSDRSEEHTSELQSLSILVCRLLLDNKKNDCTQLSQ